MAEKDIPPGWSSNPSAWSERSRPLALAIVGLAVASYLTAFQVGLVRSIWEPFFGNSSRAILTSPIARALPIPDAALGAGAYLIDLVCGLTGGPIRWRTMPWIVLLFGLVVGVGGLISLLLVIAQGAVFHTWCTLCLASAAVSLGLAGLASPEVRASVQHLKRTMLEGASLWEALRGIGEPRRAEDSAAW